jgi:transcriptional regulator with XRE-family HTH domain
MSGSTLPRRALGRRLRDLRLAANKSKLAAAVAIDISKSSLGRLEDGEAVRVSSAQFRELLRFFGADEAATNEVFGLLQEARATKGDPTIGWWRAYSDVVNPHFDHFMGLEQACSRMTTFQLTLLPGLLQTPAYRRWIMATTDPAMSTVDAERQLELMALRQNRLTGDPRFSLDVLLSESALRHQVGGRVVMREQGEHLITIGRLPNVSIRVIPFGVGEHPGLVVQSFTLFEFPSLHPMRVPEPPVVFVEGFTGALFLEDDALIERHRSATEGVRQVALNEDDTRRLVQQIAEEYAA